MYQNTAMTKANTGLLGGFILYSATTVGASWTNIGLGRAFSITENISPYNSQANNGPDPVEGVARQTATITFELLEYYPPTFDNLRGGSLDTEATSTTPSYIATASANTISTGGKTEIAPVAFKFINRKLVSGATVETAVVIYRAFLRSGGFSFTSVSDNAEDPITVWPWTFETKCDSTRTVGDQLMKVETHMGTT